MFFNWAKMMRQSDDAAERLIRQLDRDMEEISGSVLVPAAVLKQVTEILFLANDIIGRYATGRIDDGLASDAGKAKFGIQAAAVALRPYVEKDGE